MRSEYSNEDDRALAAAWRQAASTDEVSMALRSIYQDIERATSERQPLCTVSGRCCHFEQYGHRLYITGLEAAFVVSQLQAGARRLTRETLSDAISRGTCPFLVDERCSIHALRPMGCRLYFCDPTAQEWQRQNYEQAHQRVVSIHDARDVPYRYGEWRAMLGMLVGGEQNESQRDARPPGEQFGNPQPPSPSPTTPFVELRIQ